MAWKREAMYPPLSVADGRLCDCPEALAGDGDYPDDMHTHDGCRIYHRGKICIMTKPKSELDPMVFSALSSMVSVSPDGDKRTDLKIVSNATDGARRISTLVGKSVQLTAGSFKTMATVKSVTLMPDPKRDTVVVARAKLGGAADLDKLVGRQVKIEKAQRELPGVEDV